MSSLWFLKLAIKCLDHFAWPLLALGYPLCASVQAFETGACKETRDLISYWILLSLIYLFEYAFSRLLQWFQFWPYFKLMIICLIIPDFGRASYAYNNFIRTYVYFNPQAVISRLNNRRKFFVKNKNDDFLQHVERYVNENGTEALEKLITSKNIPFVPGGELPQSSTHKEVPKEWTCDLCHIKTSCEKNLISHMDGSKHKATCEALKAKYQPVPQKVKSDESKEELKQKNTINQINSNTKNGESIVNKGSKGEKEVVDYEVQKKPAGTNHSKFRCDVCNVYCPCEITLASHKNGKKHLAKIKILI